MKKFFLNIFLVLGLSWPMQSFSFWGNPADTAYLAKILFQAIKQLNEMKKVVGSTKDTLNIARDLNRGINEALNLLKTAYPDNDLAIYKDWDSLQEALTNMEDIYGQAVNSKESASQGHLDQSIAEAILMYNKVNQHTKRIDGIGESISSQSRRASPKGAARLQAQAGAVGLHVQNQNLRTQSALLKLEAQNSAIKNKKEKDETRFFIDSAQKLKKAMKEHEPIYKTPRF